MFRISMHVYNVVEHDFDLFFYWTQDIPDICAMEDAVPTCMDIMALDEYTMNYAYVGDEQSIWCRSK